MLKVNFFVELTNIGPQKIGDVNKCQYQKVVVIQR